MPLAYLPHSIAAAALVAVAVVLPFRTARRAAAAAGKRAAVAPPPLGLRLVCVSDTHGRHRNVNVPPGDILIHAGDFTHFGKETDVTDFNDWLGEQDHSHKIVINGGWCNKRGAGPTVPPPQGCNLSVAAWLDAVDLHLSQPTHTIATSLRPRARAPAVVATAPFPRQPRAQCALEGARPHVIEQRHLSL